MAARTAGRSRMVRAGRACAAIVALGVAMIGCTRSYYRNYADKDVYAIERERDLDPRWHVPTPAGRGRYPHADRRPVQSRQGARPARRPRRPPVPGHQRPSRRVLQVGEARRRRRRAEEWKALLPRNPDGSVQL